MFIYPLRFAHFESVFELWKREFFHPFRVASSETMRHPDGQQDPFFRYKYIVYHCVHYGNPRMRGLFVFKHVCH